jgi:mercuric ion transport protein
MALAGIGAAVLVVVCCAAPALLAAGALGVLGGALRSPWVIVAAVVLAVGALTRLLRRRSAGRDACCPPAPRGTDRAPDRDRPRDPAETDGRYHP